jgi:hypothetical protein
VCALTAQITSGEGPTHGRCWSTLRQSACGRLPPTARAVGKQELEGREGVAAARRQEKEHGEPPLYSSAAVRRVARASERDDILLAPMATACL